MPWWLIKEVHGANFFLKRLLSLRWSIKSPCFYRRASFISVFARSHHYSTCWVTLINPNYLITVLIAFHPCLDRRIGRFLLGSSLKFCIHFSSLPRLFHTLRSSSLRNFLLSVVPFFLLGPSSPLSSPFLNTPDLCSSLRLSDQVSHP